VRARGAVEAGLTLAGGVEEGLTLAAARREGAERRRRHRGGGWRRGSGGSGERRGRPAHYFSCPVGLDAVSIKSVIGQVVLNFYFCIQWDLWVT
jgi:hypothetical protein